MYSGHESLSGASAGSARLTSGEQDIRSRAVPACIESSIPIVAHQILTVALSSRLQSSKELSKLDVRRTMAPDVCKILRVASLYMGTTVGATVKLGILNPHYLRQTRTNYYNDSMRAFLAYNEEGTVRLLDTANDLPIAEQAGNFFPELGLAARLWTGNELSPHTNGERMSRGQKLIAEYLQYGTAALHMMQRDRTASA
jgi:hypothetical protein